MTKYVAYVEIPSARENTEHRKSTIRLQCAKADAFFVANSNFNIVEMRTNSTDETALKTCISILYQSGERLTNSVLSVEKASSINDSRKVRSPIWKSRSSAII